MIVLLRVELSMDEIRNDVVVSDTSQYITHKMTSTQEPHRSARIIRPLVRFISPGETYEAISEEAESNPYTYKEAMKDIDAHHWAKAMKFELDSMYSNQVWDLVKMPNGIKPVGCKWVYKRKFGNDYMNDCTPKSRVINDEIRNDVVVSDT